MAKRRRETRTGQQRDRGDTDGGSIERGLAQLGESFVKFRQENRPRTRIPDYLRDAVLEAVETGIPDAEVIRTCRLSRELLHRWREVKYGYARRAKSKKAKARVFPVVEDQVTGPRSAVKGGEETSHLQLRIGGWDISIRQNGQ